MKSGLARRCWRVVLAAAAIVAVVPVSAALLAGCPRPDFAEQAQPAGAAERQVPLPVLSVPEADIAAGNELVAVFVAIRAPGRAELTLVFRDEDQPMGIADLGYDIYRWFEWGRIADVETLEVSYDPERLIEGIHPLEEIRLHSVYAGEQPFDVGVAEHFSKDLLAEDLVLEGGRPLLYIATWNHMLSERDTSPSLTKRRITSVPVYRGDRAAVERLYEEARRGTR